MAKNETAAKAVEEVQGDTPEAEAVAREVARAPRNLTVSKDNLVELAQAFARVGGYYAGTAYESDRDDGIATLSKYGIVVSE
jgi:hypothetical protein